MPQQPVQFIHYQPNVDPRQSGMFTPPPHEQPSGYCTPMHGYPHGPAPGYPPQMWQPYPPTAPFVHPRLMTPTASPPPVGVAPKIMVEQVPALGPLDTKFIVESRHSPSPPTPSLSACPSTVSSPPASSIYQTPVNGGGYFNLAAEPVKDEPNMMSFLEQEWSETSRKSNTRASRSH
jgi:hypothetical protein